MDREGLADRHVIRDCSLQPQVIAGAESRIPYVRKSKRIDVEHVIRITSTLIGIGSGLKARREVWTSGENGVEVGNGLRAVGVGQRKTRRIG